MGKSSCSGDMTEKRTQELYFKTATGVIERMNRCAKEWARRGGDRSRCPAHAPYQRSATSGRQLLRHISLTLKEITYFIIHHSLIQYIIDLNKSTRYFSG
jgi:hypothetical protein